MATSGTYTDHANNIAVIGAALRKINRLGDFETLTDTDARYLAGLAALKLICKEFSNYGMPLWAIDELAIPMSNFTTAAGITIALTGGTITNVPPLKILQALRRDTLADPDIDVPMMLYSADDYNNLPQKGVTGCPTGWVYYPADVSSVNPVKSTLKIWPLPDTYWSTNGQVYIRFQRPIQDVGTSTQDLDFPAEWQRAIVYALAYDLSPEYGLDISQRQALKGDRDQLVNNALSFMTEEGSLYLQPQKR